MEESELQDLSIYHLYRLWLCSVLEDSSSSRFAIPNDLQNGIVLCKCIKKLRGVDLKPETKDIDSMQTWQKNIQKVLNYLCSIKADPKVTFEYIVQGDRQSMLSLLDTVILHLDIHSPDRAAYQRTKGLGMKLIMQWINNQVDAANHTYAGSLVDCFWDGELLYKLAVKFCACQTSYINNMCEVHCSQIIAVALGRFEENLNIPRGFFNPLDLAQKQLDDYILLVYLSVLRRKILGSKSNLINFEGPVSPTSEISDVSPRSKGGSYNNSFGEPEDLEENDTSFASQQSVSSFNEQPSPTKQQQKSSLQSLFEKLQRSTSPVKNKSKSATVSNVNKWNTPLKRQAQSDNNVGSMVDHNTSSFWNYPNAQGNSDACKQNATWSTLPSMEKKLTNSNSQKQMDMFKTQSVSESINTDVNKEVNPFSDLMTLALKKGYTRSGPNSPSKAFPDPCEENRSLFENDSERTSDTELNLHAVEGGKQVDQTVDIAQLVDAVENFHLSTPKGRQAKYRRRGSDKEQERVDFDEVLDDLGKKPDTQNDQMSPIFPLPPDLSRVNNSAVSILEKPTDIVNAPEGVEQRNQLPNENNFFHFDSQYLSAVEDYEADELMVYFDYIYIISQRQEMKKEELIVNTLKEMQSLIKKEIEMGNIPENVYSELCKVEIGDDPKIVNDRCLTTVNYDKSNKEQLSTFEDFRSQSQRVRELEFENTVLKRRLDSFEKRHILAQNRIGLKEDENEKLQAKLAKANKKLSGLIAEIEENTATRREEVYLKEGNIDLVKMQKLLEEKLESKQEEIDDLNTKIQQQIRIKQQNERQHVATISDLKVKINELECRNFTLETENESNQTIIKHLERKVDGFAADISHSEHENNMTLHEITLTKTENQILKEKIDRLESEVIKKDAILTSDVMAYQNSGALLDELHNLENSLNDLRTEKEALEAKYLNKKRECQELEFQLDVLRKQTTKNLARHFHKKHFHDGNKLLEPLSLNEHQDLSRGHSFASSNGSDNLPNVMVVTSPSNNKINERKPSKSYSAEDTRLFVKSMEERLQKNKTGVNILRNSYRT